MARLDGFFKLKRSSDWMPCLKSFNISRLLSDGMTHDNTVDSASRFNENIFHILKSISPRYSLQIRSPQSSRIPIHGESHLHFTLYAARNSSWIGWLETNDRASGIETFMSGWNACGHRHKLYLRLMRRQDVEGTQIGDAFQLRAIRRRQIIVFNSIHRNCFCDIQWLTLSVFLCFQNVVDDNWQLR